MQDEKQEKKCRMNGEGIHPVGAGEIHYGTTAGCGDAQLRGLDVSAVPETILGGTYDTLVDLMTAGDRVIGLL